MDMHILAAGHIWTGIVQDLMIQRVRIIQLDQVKFFLVIKWANKEAAKHEQLKPMMVYKFFSHEDRKIFQQST